MGLFLRLMLAEHFLRRRPYISHQHSIIATMTVTVGEPLTRLSATRHPQSSGQKAVACQKSWGGPEAGGKEECCHKRALGVSGKYF